MLSEPRAPLGQGTQDVTVVGEALVDIISQGGTATEAPGGSPLNVAIGLARLGRRASLVSRIGDDQLGDVLRSHLIGSGVDLSFALLVPRTSTASAHLNSDGSAAYDFDIEWTLPDELAVPESRVLHVGSIGSWLEPGATAVDVLVRTRPRHQVASFDPNIRPSLIHNRGHIIGRLERLVAAVDIVKLSDEDAGWWFPDSSPQWVLDRLLDLGAGVAVMTRGDRGAVARTRDSRVLLAAPPVHVVDTIGAGDSFMAGLLDGWLEAKLSRGGVPGQEDLKRLVRHALAAAAITVSRTGANPPWRRELMLKLARR